MTLQITLIEGAAAAPEPMLYGTRAAAPEAQRHLSVAVAETPEEVRLAYEVLKSYLLTQLAP